MPVRPVRYPWPAGDPAAPATQRWLPARKPGPGESSRANHPTFEPLDKPIVVDAAQHSAVQHAAPLVLIGSATGQGRRPVQTQRFRPHGVGRGRQLRAPDPAFAKTGLPAIFELPAPHALDVQTYGRLVRLERRQGEYWLLTLILAGLKTQWSRCVTGKLEPWKYAAGFFADQLHEVLAELPSWLWPDKRRKRTHINQVLARSELGSNYQPARQLWVRARNGHYLPITDAVVPG